MASARPIQLATTKLERLIQFAPSFEGDVVPNTPLRTLPVHPNYIIDVKRVVFMQKEIRRFDRLIALNPSNSDAFFKRANLNYQISDLESAKRDYTRTLDLDPDNTAAMINRGALRRQSGQLIAAIEDYDRAIAIAPNDPDAFRNRGIARELKGDLDGAVSDWTRASKLGDREAEQWVAIAKPVVSQEDYAMNLMLQMHGSGSIPSLPAPHHADDAQSSDGLKPWFKGKIKEYSVALRSNPGDIALLFKRGTEHLQQGNDDLAIADFSNVISKQPSFAKAVFNRAVARRRQGYLRGALGDYDRVITLLPRDRDAYRNRGIVKQLLGSQVGACADWGVAASLGDAEVKKWVSQECQ